MSHHERCPKSKRCRVCTRDRKRNRENQRQKFLSRMAWAKATLGNRCAIPDCENTDLEFDHINPKEKTANIPCIWSRSFAVFEAEVRKCQLLCHVHHRMKTLGIVDTEFNPREGANRLQQPAQQQGDDHGEDGEGQQGQCDGGHETGTDAEARAACEALERSA